MARTKKTGSEGNRLSADKRNFFATMSADVIKSIKLAALQDDMTASDILEDAAKQWLKKRRVKKK